MNLNKLPAELIIDILQKLNINELVKTCKTDKRMYAICKNNHKLFSKKILEIPIRYSVKPKYFNDIQDIDYYEVMLFFVNNNFIKDNSIRLPYVDDKLNQKITINVLKFLIGNGYDINKYKYVYNSLLKQNLTLDTLKYLIEIKNVEVKDDLLNAAICNDLDIVKYILDKGFKKLHKYNYNYDEKNKNCQKTLKYVVKKLNFDKKNLSKYFV